MYDDISTMAVDIYAGEFSSYPSDLTAVNGRLFFIASESPPWGLEVVNTAKKFFNSLCNNKELTGYYEIESPDCYKFVTGKRRPERNS